MPAFSPIASSFETETARGFAAASVLALLAMLPLRLVLRHAMVVGLPHLTLWRPPANLDFGVVALFVPLCAIVLAMLVTVVRLLAEGGLPEK